MRKIVITKEFLYDEYVIKDKTSRQIGKILNLSKTCILRKLKEFNIPLKVTIRTSGRKNNKQYLIGEISKTFWGMIKRCAKIRNLDFDITPEYIWLLFIEQKRCCKLTGMELTTDCVSSDKTRYNRTASLDRIDSNKGYVINNVQWVHKYINQMKWEFSQEKFIELCKLVTTKNCEAIT